MMTRITAIRWRLARLIQPEVARLEQRLRNLEVWAAEQDELLAAEFERGYREGFAEGHAASGDDRAENRETNILGDA